VKRIAIFATLALALAGLAGWWLLGGGFSREPRIVDVGEPLEMDETVRMRWVDEESGEEEIWTVTKREASPDDWSGPPLPEPDAETEAAHRGPNESARALLAMGLESWKNGEVEQAMEQFESAIAVDPDDPLPRTQYGRLLVLGMSYTDARTQLERAAELSPDDPQVWLDLATLYEKDLVLDRSWEARRRAEELLGDGQQVYQEGKGGFWVVEGTSIYP
jgi:tetratricopeptide (TPR) repeat protein